MAFFLRQKTGARIPRQNVDFLTARCDSKNKKGSLRVVAFRCTSSDQWLVGHARGNASRAAKKPINHMAASVDGNEAEPCASKVQPDGMVPCQKRKDNPKVLLLLH